MAIVTQNWSDFSWKPGESASITFLVSGVGLLNTDCVAAAQAQNIYGADDTCAWDYTLVANQPDVSRIGPDLWKVTCTFTRPEGGSTSPPTPNPLDEPARIKMSFSNASEEFNRDIFGNPFVNANHDPFATPFHKDVQDFEISITRNFVDFDPEWNALQNTLNADVSVLLGRYNFQIGTLRFMGANPTIEWDVRHTYLPCVAVWKWRKDGWKVRRKNEGRNGWWNNGGTLTFGQFYDKDKNPVSEDVPLGLDGIPLDPTIKIGPNREEPVSSPYPIPPTVGSEESDDGTIFLLFYAYEHADHTSLPF